MSILFGLLRHVKTLTAVNATNRVFAVLSEFSAVCNTHSHLQLLPCVKQPLLAISIVGHLKVLSSNCKVEEPGEKKNNDEDNT